jgi:hypothetical protein
MRFGLVLIPVLAVLVGSGWYRSLVTAPVVAIPFSACRLTPSLALSRGYPPYQPFDRGAIIGCFYPPISVLARLPVIVFADPTMAVLAGRLQSLLYCFLPLLWLLVMEVRHGMLKTVNALLLFLIFALLVDRVVCLRCATTEIHADAPAIALGCIALGLVGQIRSAEMSWTWYGAILASILAAWTKQVQLPLLLVPIVRAFTSFGVRTGFKVLALTCVLALVVSGLLLLAFDFQSCKLYTFDVMRRQAMKGATIGENLRLLSFALGVQMQRPFIIFNVFLLVLLVIGRIQRSEPAGTSHDYPTWLPFLIGGILEIPLSLMGYVKVGGDFNQLSFCFFPILVAQVLILGRLVASRPARECVLVALGLYLGVSEYRVFAREIQQSNHDQSGPALTWIDEQRLITRYLQSHPDQAYFPFNTFEHLAIDRRLYHFPEAVLVLESVGFKTPERNIKDYAPQRMELVCYPPSIREDAQFLRLLEHYRKTFFPEFQTRVTIAELPGFLCFARTPRAMEADVPHGTRHDSQEP